MHVAQIQLRGFGSDLVAYRVQVGRFKEVLSPTTSKSLGFEIAHPSLSSKVLERM